MKQINIQYFTTVQELLDFIEKVSMEFNLYLAHLYIINNKEEVNLLTIANINDLHIIGSVYNCIVLSIEKIKVGQNKHQEFQLENPNALYINIGEHNSEILRESWLYTLKIIKEESFHKIWIKIERKLKKITICGGWGVYAPTSEKQFYKDLRYSSGAKELFLKGIKMLSPVGNKIYFELSNASV